MINDALPLSLLLLLPSIASSLLQPISLRTTAVLEDQTPAAVQKFLASPGNWPKIVTSSVGVESDGADVEQPLPVGQTVDEIFGLPPVLPLAVRWTCTKSVLASSGSTDGKKRTPGFWGIPANRPPLSSGGRLEFSSADGLENVARNCRMNFDVQRQGGNNGEQNTKLVLDMSYEPVSPLAVLAVPVLTVDNAIAIKFLLPAALRTQPELDKFRALMGSLYLVAGLAHSADCLAGGSQLLTFAGCPSFYELPLVGQLLALLWCAMGPISFALRDGKGYADMGLIGYGAVEVIGAGLITLNYGSGADGMNAFLNAVLVQSVVAGAWFYSASKKPASES
eukprot:CAMPEP_0172534820 /NCGR_PEP_ID=MMETSP1067-20121228/7059_1 /TAXON_ID=265564 ORGANISM="Thalassiosira punctigera, Strain Tpunct2005C2" /NCGR_SAMPLE_ID=MMETSP1067 /ASSEMBLY_ACC=CAM_ASM_000444 /LENGTH=336 /DNA_ID=CAMNT_0013319665 /DNA_START=91 /DNA_END=1101 /DNA_ORIENTATION=+